MRTRPSRRRVALTRAASIEPAGANRPAPAGVGVGAAGTDAVAVEAALGDGVTAVRVALGWGVAWLPEHPTPAMATATKMPRPAMPRPRIRRSGPLFWPGPLIEASRFCRRSGAISTRVIRAVTRSPSTD